MLIHLKVDASGDLFINAHHISCIEERYDREDNLCGSIVHTIGGQKFEVRESTLDIRKAFEEGVKC